MPSNPNIYFQPARGGLFKRQWRFNIRSTGNHKVLAPSELYHNYQDMIDTIHLIDPEADIR